MTDLQARAEAAADAVAKAIYGPGFDPHLDPEAWDWCAQIADAAIQSECSTPAETIGHLAQRILELAPAAGLYVGIKIEPLPPEGETP